MNLEQKEVWGVGRQRETIWQTTTEDKLYDLIAKLFSHNSALFIKGKLPKKPSVDLFRAVALQAELAATIGYGLFEGIDGGSKSGSELDINDPRRIVVDTGHLADSNMRSFPRKDKWVNILQKNPKAALGASNLHIRRGGEIDADNISNALLEIKAVERFESGRPILTPDRELILALSGMGVTRYDARNMSLEEFAESLAFNHYSAAATRFGLLNAGALLGRSNQESLGEPMFLPATNQGTLFDLP